MKTKTNIKAGETLGIMISTVERSRLRRQRIASRPS
jgi:hypothetical protein